MKWKDKVINYLIDQLRNDTEWKSILENLLVDYSIGIHLGIFSEPFLSLILSKKKTIESRFSVNRISPFGKINEGDIVLIKSSGGNINGVFIAGHVSYYRNLNNSLFNKIESDLGEEICTSYDKEFWNHQQGAKYATLIEINKIKALTPFKCEKNDRMGWSILREGESKNLFNHMYKSKLDTIIVVMGQIGSGKSYTANIIQRKYNFPIASFGSYLKEYCQNNNLPFDRKTLQDTGNSFVKNAPEQFLINVVTHFKNEKNSIILDGVRHYSILKLLSSLTKKLIKIYIDADMETRYNRYSKRNKDTDEIKNKKIFTENNDHIVEMEIESLKKYCDIVLKSDENLNCNILNYLSKMI